MSELKIDDIEQLSDQEKRRLTGKGLSYASEVTELLLGNSEAAPDLFPNIISVALSSCEMTCLDLSRNSHLTTLEVTDCNGLSEVIFGEGSNLKDVTIKWCESLCTLDVSPLKNLKRLELVECESLSEVSFGDACPLKEFTRRSNMALPWFDLSSVPHLEVLAVEDEEVENMEAFSLKETPRLAELSLCIEALEEPLDFSCDSLRRLSVSAFHLDALDLQGCPNLAELELVFSETVTALDLQALPGLRRLIIEDYEALSSIVLNPLSRLDYIKIKQCDVLEELKNMALAEGGEDDIRVEGVRS